MRKGSRGRLRGGAFYMSCLTHRYHDRMMFITECLLEKVVDRLQASQAFVVFVARDV